MNNLFLSSIYRGPAVVSGDTFPWTLPLFRDLKRLEFSSRMTFLVGENGSGKSTLLEGLAGGTRAIATRSGHVAHGGTMWAAHEVTKAFRFVWRQRPKPTNFLQAGGTLAS